MERNERPENGKAAPAGAGRLAFLNLRTSNGGVTLRTLIFNGGLGSVGPSLLTPLIRRSRVGSRSR